MSVKGQEFPAYDARGIQGMGLTYATSNRGACHLRSYTVASEVLGIPVKTDPLVRRRQARAGDGVPGRHRRLRLAGMCIFTTFAWGLADLAAAAGAACGPEFTLENWPRSASASGTWSATSTTAPASPPRTTRCRRAC
jgi:aldehyde:ferredoxin oxidoreductase